MDGEHTLIIELIKEQDGKRDIQISAIQKNMDVGFDLLAAEMSKMTEQKVIQNGRVDKLEKSTKINSFVISYPKLSILIGIVGYYGLAEILSLISIVDVIKKYLL